jgi:hypothetical protein
MSIKAVIKKYVNKLILNQRGGSLVIDNTTEQESVQLSHRSGSNVVMNNVVNSELATNNKQTLVVGDKFDDTKNDSIEHVGGDKVVRVSNNHYSLKGFDNDQQIEQFAKWHEAFKETAQLNSKFKIKRGGFSVPNGVVTDLEGERADNPVLKNRIVSVENEFKGYSGIPVRTRNFDEVVSYSTVPDRGNTKPAEIRETNVEEIEKSAGLSGSGAPGVLKYGGDKSAATEEGSWSDDEEAQKIGQKILETQDVLTSIEQEMGESGDEILFVKRNKSETVGAHFNDYPSLRIDPEGRSQPLEMLVSDTGVFKNHDFTPHVEELDNSSNYPCGNDVKVVGNSYRRNVGSGGVSMKTIGLFEIGGSSIKVGGKKVHINASHGIQIGSETCVEIQSLKSVIIRSNRQVLIEAPVGVKDNLIVGGATYTEGETYLHHVTAPLEVQQTRDTVVTGQFNALEDRTLKIGETLVAGTWYPTYAVVSPDTVVSYPHSHHFDNIPLRLTASNKDLRKLAQDEGINRPGFKTQARPQIHERKDAIKTD